MSSKSLKEMMDDAKQNILIESARRMKEQATDAARFFSDDAFAEAVVQEATSFHLKREASRRAAKVAREIEAAKAAGVPLRVYSWIGQSGETEACRVVKDFMHGPKILLVLAGGVGTGKSVAVGIACGKIPMSGYDPQARFIKSMDLLQMGIYGEEAEKFARDCKRLDLLVIDDVGTEPRDEKGYAAANFEAALDARYDAESKTILTTNLDFETFKKRYCTGGGERLLDRLREVGIFHGLAGKSLRIPR